MFYDIDNTPIKVTLKEFIKYANGLNKNIYTTFPYDTKKAKIYTNLTTDQIMFIKVHFITLSNLYKYNISAQKFAPIDKKETKS